MASTTFTWTPSYPASQQAQPRVRKVQFGDGYEQRLRYGLRTDLRQWDLVFENRTDSERNEIVQFLAARAGVEQFNWTNPFGLVSQFVCESWISDHIGCNLNTIRATFREVLDA
jgi:phage-related protein